MYHRYRMVMMVMNQKLWTACVKVSESENQQGPNHQKKSRRWRRKEKDHNVSRLQDKYCQRHLSDVIGVAHHTSPIHQGVAIESRRHPISQVLDIRWTHKVERLWRYVMLVVRNTALFSMLLSQYNVYSMLESFSYEWEVATVRFVLCSDHIMPSSCSIQAFWLVEKWFCMLWLVEYNMSSIPYRDHNSVP